MIDGPGAVGEAGEHVLALEIGKVGEQLVDARARRQRVEHVGHAHPRPRHDRPSAAHGRINHDALLRHVMKVLMGGGEVNRGRGRDRDEGPTPEFAPAFWCGTTINC